MAIKQRVQGWWAKLGRGAEDLRDDVQDSIGTDRVVRVGLTVIAVIVLSLTLLGWYWSNEPELVGVNEITANLAQEQNLQSTTGSATTATAIYVARTMLDKPGGFLHNDVFPPGIFMDNMPNWEYGVLVQTRDMVRALRENFSRSQSQSTEDPDLTLAEPRFNFKASSWILPPSESEYRGGIKLLLSYHQRLADPENPQAQFYARADNLRFWLGMVSTRMGSMSQRLASAVEQNRVNTDLAGDSAALQSTPRAAEIRVKTPWMEIDDVFYESRGAAWAWIHFLRAAEKDFAPVLAKKNAQASLAQIIRELEQTQYPVYSPLILNGNGFGLVANHSLVMASYIAGANAALIDLRALLSDG
ncbi:MAG: DUF2333 family protein [Pseudomonadales bacterium]